MCPPRTADHVLVGRQCPPHLALTCGTHLSVVSSLKLLHRVRHGMSPSDPGSVATTHRPWCPLLYIRRPCYPTRSTTTRKTHRAELGGSRGALLPTWTSGCSGVRKSSVGSDTLSTFEEAIRGIGWTGGSRELDEFITGPQISAVGHGASRAEGSAAPLPIRITLSGLLCSSIHSVHSLVRIRALWWPMLLLIGVLCRVGWGVLA